jgi:serine/threonine protein kinase
MGEKITPVFSPSPSASLDQQTKTSTLLNPESTNKYNNSRISHAPLETADFSLTTRDDLSITASTDTMDVEKEEMERVMERVIAEERREDEALQRPHHLLKNDYLNDTGIFAGRFAVERFFSRGSRIVRFKDANIEASYRLYVREDCVRRVQSGMKVVMFMALALNMTSIANGNYRLVLVISVLAGLMLVPYFYYNNERLCRAYDNGWDTTKPFFVLGLILILYFAIIAVVDHQAVLSHPSVIETLQSDEFASNMNPNPRGRQGLSYVDYAINMTDTFQQIGVIPVESALPLLENAIVALPMSFYITVQMIINVALDYLQDFGPSQLVSFCFLQCLGFAFMQLGNQFTALSSFTSVLFFGSAAFVLPTLNKLRAIRRKQLESRANYIRWKIAEERKNKLESTLQAANDHLQELNNKLRLTEDQMELVKKSTVDLKYLSSYEIDMERDLHFEKKLGEGAFGIVYLAKFRGETVAVKQLISEKINAENMTRFKEEIVLLTQLHHPNICQLLAASWVAPNLAIVLEFAANGDLQYYLKKHGKGVTWGDKQSKLGTRLKFISNCAQGLRHLRNCSKPIMHRDLKCENCLITEFNVLKLSDFGESKAVKDDGDGSEMTLVGTPYFIAPEVLRGEDYSVSCDVFSFAILLGCLGVPDGNPKKLFSEDLREGKPITNLAKARLKGMHIANSHAKGWRVDLTKLDWPQMMKELVEACWQDNAESRPTFNEICDSVDSWSEDDFKSMRW